MLDLRRLHTFVTVARVGSVSAAAAELAMVPSAVSQHITVLQRQLGVKLTDRSGRGIVLTAAGQLLAEYGQELLARANHLSAALESFQGSSGGRLRIASFQSAGATLVPQALGALSRLRPGVALTLVEQEAAVSIPAVKRYEVDLAIVYRYDFVPLARDDALLQLALVEDHLRLAVPPTHPLAGAGPTPLSEFSYDQWIADAPGSPAHAFITHVCRAAGFEPRIRFTTDDYLVAARLVMEGLGVTFIPWLALRGLTVNLTFADLTVQPKRQILAVWRRDDWSAEVRTMVDLLVRQPATVPRQRRQPARPQPLGSDDEPSRVGAAEITRD